MTAERRIGVVTDKCAGCDRVASVYFWGPTGTFYLCQGCIDVVNEPMKQRAEEAELWNHYCPDCGVPCKECDCFAALSDELAAALQRILVTRPLVSDGDIRRGVDVLARYEEARRG